MNAFKSKNYLLFSILISLFAATQSLYSAEVDKAFSKAAFHAADHNKDGYINEAEYAANIIETFVAMDKNKDEKIEKNELIDPNIEKFKKIDSNNDNMLTFNEIMQSKMDDFEAIDKDKDGRLSLKETIAYDKAQ